MFIAILLFCQPACILYTIITMATAILHTFIISCSSIFSNI